MTGIICNACLVGMPLVVAVGKSVDMDSIGSIGVVGLFALSLKLFFSKMDKQDERFERMAERTDDREDRTNRTIEKNTEAMQKIKDTMESVDGTLVHCQNVHAAMQKTIDYDKIAQSKKGLEL